MVYSRALWRWKCFRLLVSFRNKNISSWQCFKMFFFGSSLVVPGPCAITILISRVHTSEAYCYCLSSHDHVFLLFLFNVPTLISQNVLAVNFISSLSTFRLFLSFFASSLSDSKLCSIQWLFSLAFAPGDLCCSRKKIFMAIWKKKSSITFRPYVHSRNITRCVSSNALVVGHLS